METREQSSRGRDRLCFWHVAQNGSPFRLAGMACFAGQSQKNRWLGKSIYCTAQNPHTKRAEEHQADRLCINFTYNLFYFLWDDFVPHTFRTLCGTLQLNLPATCDHYLRNLQSAIYHLWSPCSLWHNQNLWPLLASLDLSTHVGTFEEIDQIYSFGQRQSACRSRRPLKNCLRTHK